MSIEHRDRLIPKQSSLAAFVLSKVFDKRGMTVWKASRHTSRLRRAVNQIGTDRGERMTSRAPGRRVCVGGAPGAVIKDRDISHTG